MTAEGGKHAEDRMPLGTCLPTSARGGCLSVMSAPGGRWEAATGAFEQAGLHCLLHLDAVELLRDQVAGAQGVVP